MLRKCPIASCGRRAPRETAYQARANGRYRAPISVQDTRFELWQALLMAGANQAAAVAAEASAAAATTATKLQRYLEGPPPNFPPGPAGDQSVGMIADPLAFIQQQQQQYGGLVGMLLGGERVVLVADPKAAQQILIEQPDVFVKEGTAFFPGSSLTGNGLLVSDGEVWKRQRRLSNPAFRKAAVDTYAEQMVACTQQLMAGRFAEAAGEADPGGAGSGPKAAAAAAAAAAAGVRDVYADYNELTLNITLAALFGITTTATAQPGAGSSSGSSSSSSGLRSDSSNTRLIVESVEKAFAYFASRGAAALAVPEWVPLPANVEFKAAVMQLDSVMYDIIAARRAELWGEVPAAEGQTHPGPNSSSSSRQQQRDLLQALLDSRDDSGQGMSDEGLRDELMTLLVAGQETSAILLGWTTALLAYHPEVQQEAAEEVEQVLGGAIPTAADVGKLPLLLGVILEALRLYSPAYMVGRCANREVQLLGQYSLPAGTTVLVSPFLLHRDPSRWEEPLAFQPERWLQEQQEEDESAKVGRSSKPSTTSSTAPKSSSSSRIGGSSGDSGSSNRGETHGPATPASGSSGYSFMAVLRGMGPNGAYVPFGGGPRNCIGTGFSMMEALLVMAALLQRYEVQPPYPGAPFPRPKALLTLRPEAVPLKVLPRPQKPQQQQQQQGIAGSRQADGQSGEAVATAGKGS